VSFATKINKQNKKRLVELEGWKSELRWEEDHSKDPLTIANGRLDNK
jgi:hypothetical protein